MLKDSSAPVREQSPHVDALKQRAHAIIKDKSIDPDSRAIVSYALQIDDPWLPELVRSVDAGENIAEPFEYPRAAAVVEVFSREETCNEDESNLLGLVDTQTAVIEAELLAGKMRTC